MVSLEPCNWGTLAQPLGGTAVKIAQWDELKEIRKQEGYPQLQVMELASGRYSCCPCGRRTETETDVPFVFA